MTAMFALPPQPVATDPVIQSRIEFVANANQVAPLACSPHTITWVPKADLQENVIGMAYPSNCAVFISNDVTPAVACRTLVHEFGHLAGLGHSSDQNDPMFPTITNNPVACNIDPVLNPESQPTITGLAFSIWPLSLTSSCKLTRRRGRFRTFKKCGSISAIFNTKTHQWDWTWTAKSL